MCTASVSYTHLIRSPDQAREEQLPAVLISGGGGYYVTGAMSETELQTLHVGDTVTVMSWQTYSQTEAEICLLYTSRCV